MATVINGELVLDLNETVDLIRNMTQPDLEAISRRDYFLRDRDDITFSFSDEGIIAECSTIEPLEEKQQIYDSQRIIHQYQGNVSYVQQSLGFNYSRDYNYSCFSSGKKDEEWCNNPELTKPFIARAA